MNTIIGAYPGSPEAVSPAETGDRYVLSLTINNDEMVQIKRLTVNTITVAAIDFVCDDRSIEELAGIVTAQRNEKKILALTLTGKRSFILPKSITENINNGFYRIELNDRSTLALPALAGQFIHERSARGDYFRLLTEKMKNGEVPADVDGEKLAHLLTVITGDKKIPTEEWLCTLLQS
jgi:hypothetical protein